MIRHAHLASLIYNTPLMIDFAKAEVIEQVFMNAQLQKIEQNLVASNEENEVIISAGNVNYINDGVRRPYAVTESGIGVIQIHGTLVHRAMALDAMSGLTGYNRLAGTLKMAANDPMVKSILLEMDTPGGMVSGLYDLCDLIKQIDQTKPIWSISNEAMYSAGQAIGVSARHTTAAETAGSGSVGVIALHMDQSQKDKADGKKYTAIFAGDRKNELSSHAPLSAETVTRLQSSINYYYDLFVQRVADNRPMSEQQVRDTQAGTFNSKEAKELGLIDEVMTFDQTIEAMESKYGTSSNTNSQVSACDQKRGVEMNDKTTPLAETSDGFKQADLDKAKAEGVSQGVKQERERASAILQCEESKGREAQAVSMVCNTELPADQAAKLLASMPESATLEATTDTGFTAAMGDIENPEVGSEQSEDEITEQQVAENIVALVQPGAK